MKRNAKPTHKGTDKKGNQGQADNDADCIAMGMEAEEEKQRPSTEEAQY
jgi:hypothetical protein